MQGSLRSRGSSSPQARSSPARLRALVADLGSPRSLGCRKPGPSAHPKLLVRDRPPRPTPPGAALLAVQSHVRLLQRWFNGIRRSRLHVSVQHAESRVPTATAHAVAPRSCALERPRGAHSATPLRGQACGRRLSAEATSSSTDCARLAHNVSRASRSRSATWYVTPVHRVPDLTRAWTTPGARAPATPRLLPGRLKDRYPRHARKIFHKQAANAEVSLELGRLAGRLRTTPPTGGGRSRCSATLRMFMSRLRLPELPGDRHSGGNVDVD